MASAGPSMYRKRESEDVHSPLRRVFILWAIYGRRLTEHSH